MAAPGSPNQHVLEQQRFFQSAKALTHLKAPRDRLTSVLIPAAFAAVAGALVARGVWNLAHGYGKME
eukprot:SM000543S17873  [mRNA]  locus=s543:1426:2026:- [translate_table: standard]